LDDNACFDVLVRYAIGYRQLSAGDVDLRTLYSFRERLSRYMQETGVNLLDQAFAQGTDAHIHAFALKTGNQRMNSTLLASNIRRMRRVHLLVTVLQRVHRMVGEADQRRDAELLAPDLKGHAGQYVYRLKTEDLAEQLRRGWQDTFAYQDLRWLAARTLSGEAAVRCKRCWALTPAGARHPYPQAPFARLARRGWILPHAMIFIAQRQAMCNSPNIR